MKKLLQRFESRQASVICITFAFVNRVVFESLYASIGRDARLQITFARNFLAGKGMGVTKYFSTDLNQPFFDTTQHFPPGLSFVIIPFLALFRDDYSAMFAFDIVNIIFFLLAIRLLAKTLGLPVAISNVLMLIAGCSRYSFFTIGSCSDLISLTIILFNLNFLIKIIRESSRLTPVAVLGYGFLFFLPFFLRYMYLPVSLLFPAVIYSYGSIHKKSELKKNGLWLFVVVGFFMLLMMFLSLRFSGNFLYVVKTGRGIFFDQLVHWYPFIPASFADLEFMALLLRKFSGLDYARAFTLFEIANGILLVVVLWALVRFLVFLKREQFSPAYLFIVSGSLVSICVLSVLTYFSLTYKPQVWSDSFLWNYNYESRYFAFIYVFLPFVLLLSVSVYKTLLKHLLFKGLAVAGLCFLSLEIIHGIYYNAKIISRQKDTTVVKQQIAEIDYWQFPDMLKELTKDHPGHTILVTACNPMLLNVASQMGYKTIFDCASLNKVNLTVNKKSLLLFPLQEADKLVMQEYLEKRKPQLIKKVGDTFFYLDEINP